MGHIISNQAKAEMDRVKTVGAHVWITGYGLGAPMYMVGKRGTVTKVNRVRVKIEIDPADRRLGEPTSLSVDPVCLRLSGTHL